MKKEMTVNDDVELQAAEKKVAELQQREALLQAQIEQTSTEPGGTPRPLLIQLNELRAGLALAQQEANQAQHRAADRLCKEIEPKARKHAARTAKALKELAAAVEVEGAFYQDLRRRGLARIYRPAHWRIDRRVAVILKSFERWNK